MRKAGFGQTGVTRRVAHCVINVKPRQICILKLKASVKGHFSLRHDPYFLNPKYPPLHCAVLKLTEVILFSATKIVICHRRPDSVINFLDLISFHNCVCRCRIGGMINGRAECYIRPDDASRKHG